MNDKVLELAKKLKELADRGERGEKDKARNILEKMMKKHGITMQDLEGEKVSHHKFSVTKEQKRFFQQVASTVIGTNFSLYISKKARNTLFLNITDMEAIEIEAKYDFYWKEYKKEMEVFYGAFLHSQNLYPKDGVIKKIGELSKEELEMHSKAQNMAGAIERRNFLKQLTPSPK